MKRKTTNPWYRLSRIFAGLTVLLIIAAAFTGCCLFGPTQADLNLATTTETLRLEREARDKEAAARAEKDKLNADRHGTAAAYTIAADEAADHIPDTDDAKLPKTAVKADLKIAIKAGDVPDQAKLAEARLMTNLILQGKLAEAEAMADKVNVRLIEAEKKSAAADARVAEAKALVDSTITNTNNALEKNRVEYEAKTASLTAEFERKELAKDKAHKREMDAKDGDLARAAQSKMTDRFVLGASICGALTLLFARNSRFTHGERVGECVCF